MLNERGTPNITGFTIGGDGTLTPLAGSTQPLIGGTAADPAQVSFNSLGSGRVSNSGLVATFALIELVEFLRSVLRSSEILVQNDAMLRQAVRTPNRRIT